MTHGGNVRILSERSGLPQEAILDFSANLNPLGPPSWLEEEFLYSLKEVSRYPDPEATRLRLAAAKKWDVDPDNVLCSNGSDELFRALARALEIHTIIAPVPCYASYGNTGLPTVCPILDAEQGFILDYGSLAEALDAVDSPSALYLGFPNNPTGILPDPESLLNLAKEYPKHWIIVDEAFLDFVDDSSLVTLGLPNLIAVRSLTKFWTLPGLRIGLALCPPGIAGRIREELSQWPVNVLAERVGARALGDLGFARATKLALAPLREGLATALDTFPEITVVPGAATNFLLLHFRGVSSSALEGAVLKRGVAIRDCANFPSLEGCHSGSVVDSRSTVPSGWIRVAVRKEEENGRLLRTLRESLDEDFS